MGKGFLLDSISPPEVGPVATSCRATRSASAYASYRPIADAAHPAPPQTFPNILLFATGSGLAPIRALIEASEENGGLAASKRHACLPCNLPLLFREETSGPSI